MSTKSFPVFDALLLLPENMVVVHLDAHAMSMNLNQRLADFFHLDMALAIHYLFDIIVDS